MAKKSSKKQPKQPNAANVGDTATAQSITTLPDNTSSATRVAFREFIELADFSSIKNFITTSSSSPDGENLKLLWGRAFKEGLIAGHKLYGKTEERLKEVEEESFQTGYNEGRRDEHEDWALDGHGMHCGGYQDTVPYDDYGTLIDPTTSPITTASENKATVTVATQTDSPVTPTFSATPTFTTGTQTESPALTIPAVTLQTRTFVENGVSTCLVPTASVTVSQAVQTSSHSARTPSLTTIGTQTNTGTSQHVHIGYYSTCGATLQSSAPFDEGKNTKIQVSTTRAITSEISEGITIFSPPTSSATTLDTSASPTATTAFQTRPTMAEIAQKPQKIEKSTISSQTTPQTLAHSSTRPMNDATRVHTSTAPSNNIVLHPPTPSSTASSPEVPVATEHEKSGVFESQSYTDYTVPITIAAGFKKHSESSDFMENRPKIEISPISIQNHHPEPLESLVSGDASTAQPPESTKGATVILSPENPSKTARNKPQTTESPISDRFDWAKDATALPITPTFPQHPPRDLSCLRSTSTHPFSSLRRRLGRPKNRRKSRNPQGHHGHWHFYTQPRHHSSHPYTPSPSLNWDQDPRLFELSQALKALGWVRR